MGNSKGLRPGVRKLLPLRSTSKPWARLDLSAQSPKCSVVEGSPSKDGPRSALDGARLSCTRSVDYADAGPGQLADRHVRKRLGLRGDPAMQLLSTCNNPDCGTPEPRTCDRASELRLFEMHTEHTKHAAQLQAPPTVGCLLLPSALVLTFWPNGTRGMMLRDEQLHD